jgi:predicted helicase
MQNLMRRFFGEGGGAANRAIVFTDPTSQKPFMTLATAYCPDMHLVGAAAGALTLAFETVDGTQRHANITDWALQRFRKHYQSKHKNAKSPITKEEIFNYVYGVLHDPIYREKYALNLKREFPKIPFYPNFPQWTEWGKQLMALHMSYESVRPMKLRRVDVTDEKSRKAGMPPKCLLKADKAAGRIVVDTETALEGVPAEAWEYVLGNRASLEWVLDQYKESTPKDPTIRERFNTYRFADYKEKVIDLLGRVAAVSVETQRIVEKMKKAPR